jgi:hypothetical protein
MGGGDGVSVLAGLCTSEVPMLRKHVVGCSYPAHMPEYSWSPPTHPDPLEDQPLGVPADPDAVIVDLPAVWVTVDMTRTGRRRLPGFVMAASESVVHVQFVSMGFVHKVWLPRERVTVRVLKPRRNDGSGPGQPH